MATVKRNKRRAGKNCHENVDFILYETWSERKTKNKLKIVILISLLCSNFVVIPVHGENPCHRVPRPANFEDRVCGPMDIRNEKNLTELCLCDVIDGDLTISGFEERNNATFMNSFSFVNLTEITHYLLIYRLAHLTTLEKWFPNLAVIRGQMLYDKNALLIYYMPQLRYLGLSSLTSIMRGSIDFIRIEKVCFWNTIDWNSITEKSTQDPNKMVICGDKGHHANAPNLYKSCPDCPISCRAGYFPSGCWGPNPVRHCQKICPPKCSGGCIGYKCCHNFCIGGCTRLNDASACTACRNLRFNGTCVKNCPSHMLKINSHRCISKAHCFEKGFLILPDKKECVKPFCPQTPGTNMCEQPCPAGYIKGRNGPVCYKCTKSNFCPSKECPTYRPGVIRSLGHADSYSGCTVINGTLSFQEFIGSEKTYEELTTIFQHLEVIHGSLEVYESNFTSLFFLSNLKKIEGNFLLPGKHSVIIQDNSNLQNLWPHDLQIGGGAMFFQGNPNLCLQTIKESLAVVHNFVNSSDSYISPLSNGYGISCQALSIKAEIFATSQYGTVILNAQLTSSHLFSDSIYYVFYKKTTEAISIKDIKEKCDYGGWKMRELQFVSSDNFPKNVFVKKITELDPYSGYAFYIKVISLSSQENVQSDVAYGRTSEFNPSAPQRLRGISVTHSTLELKWEAPDSPNGKIDHYIVSVKLQEMGINFQASVDVCKEAEKMKNCFNNIACEVNTIFEKHESAQMTLWSAEKERLIPVPTQSCPQSPVHGCCKCSLKPIPTLSVTQTPNSGGFSLPKDAYIKKLSNKKTFIRRTIISWLHEVVPNLCKWEDVVKDFLRSEEAKGMNSTQVDTYPEAIWHYLLQGSIENMCRSLLFSNFNRRIFLKFIFREILVGNSDVNAALNETLRTEKNISFPDNSYLVSLQEVWNSYPESEIRGLFRSHQQTTPKILNSGWLEHAEFLTSKTNLVVKKLIPGAIYTVTVTACQKPTTPDEPVFQIGKNRIFLLQKGKQKLCSVMGAQNVFRVKSVATAQVVSGNTIKVDILQKVPGGAVVRWQPPKSSPSNPQIIAYVVEHKNIFSDVVRTCVSAGDFESSGNKMSFRKLMPGNYSFSVRVFSTDGIGASSEFKFFTIKKSSEVEVPWPIIAVIMLAAIVVLLCTVVMWREYCSKRSADMQDIAEANWEHQISVDLRDMFRSDFIIDINDLSIDTKKPELGSGKFGKVMKGKLCIVDETWIEVAVKIPEKRHHDLLKEAKIMQDVDGPYVVKAYGVARDSISFYYVMEFMENLDLKTFLERNKDWCNLLKAPQKILQMAIEAADGMAYISSKKLVHRDLAARNCLLNGKLTLKIGDFGLSRDLKAEYYSNTDRKYLPVRWMAPESLKDGVFSTESDIWSYGVLLWEMTTSGEIPYTNYENDEIPELVVEQGQVLSCPVNCPEAIYEIMKKCWSREPEQRGQFLAIISTLLQISFPLLAATTKWLMEFQSNSYFYKVLNSDTCLSTTLYICQEATTYSDCDYHIRCTCNAANYQRCSSAINDISTDSPSSGHLTAIPHRYSRNKRSFTHLPTNITPSGHCAPHSRHTEATYVPSASTNGIGVQERLTHSRSYTANSVIAACNQCSMCQSNSGALTTTCHKCQQSSVVTTLRRNAVDSSYSNSLSAKFMDAQFKTTRKSPLYSNCSYFKSTFPSSHSEVCNSCKATEPGQSNRPSLSNSKLPFKASNSLIRNLRMLTKSQKELDYEAIENTRMKRKLEQGFIQMTPRQKKSLNTQDCAPEIATLLRPQDAATLCSDVHFRDPQSSTTPLMNALPTANAFEKEEFIETLS